MTWTTVKVLTGDGYKEIQLNIPYSRTDVINSIPSFYGGIWAGIRAADTPTSYNELLMILNNLALTVAADPFLNTAKTGMMIAIPNSPKGGVLPLTSEVEYALSQSAAVVRSKIVSDMISPELSGVTTVFSPAVYDFFLQYGTQYINDEAVPKCPLCPTPVSDAQVKITSTTSQTTPSFTLPNYWFIINQIPMVVMNRTLSAGMNLNVQQITYGITYHSHPIGTFLKTLLITTGADPNDPYVDAAATGMAMMAVSGEAVDSTVLIANPYPYIKKALYTYYGNNNNVSPQEIDDEAKSLAATITSTQTYLITGGVFADVLVFPNFGIFHTLMGTSDLTKQYDELINQFYNDINSGMNYASAWNKFISKAAPLVKRAWFSYLSSIVGELSVLKDDTQLTDKERLLAETLYNTVKDAIATLQGNMNTPYLNNMYGITVAKQAPVIWLPSAIMLKGHTILMVKYSIPKNWLDKLHLGTIDNLITRRDKTVKKYLSSICNLIAAGGEVVIDDGYKYTIMMHDGTKKEVVGRQYTTYETDDSYIITMYVPIKNDCLGTNIFYFRFNGSDYVIEPRNPFNIHSILQPTKGNMCNPFLGQNGYIVATGASEIGEQDIGPLAALIILAISISAVIVADQFFSTKSQEIQAKVEIDTMKAYEANAEALGQVADATKTGMKLGYQLVEDVCSKYGWNSPECRQQEAEFANQLNAFNNTDNNIVNAIKDNSNNMNRTYEEYTDLIKSILTSDNSIFSPKGIFSTFEHYLLYGAIAVVGIAMLPDIISLLTRTGRAIGGSMTHAKNNEKVEYVPERVEYVPEHYTAPREGS